MVGCPRHILSARRLTPSRAIPLSTYASRYWRRQLTEPSQVQGAAFALQTGVDALLLGPDNDLWNAAITAREDRNNAAKQRQSKLTPGNSSADSAAPSGAGKKQFELSTGVVTRTKEGGVGDRVCVDLIQSLAEGEGMLVGSSAKMLALVHAETFETGFVPARRVTSTLRTCFVSCAVLLHLLLLSDNVQHELKRQSPMQH